MFPFNRKKRKKKKRKEKKREIKKKIIICFSSKSKFFHDDSTIKFSYSNINIIYIYLCPHPMLQFSKSVNKVNELLLFLKVGFGCKAEKLAKFS